MKWGVGESGREKEEVYTIPVSLNLYYRLETPFSNALSHHKTDNFWVVCGVLSAIYPLPLPSLSFLSPSLLPLFAPTQVT